jgi:hypothetical protein
LVGLGYFIIASMITACTSTTSSTRIEENTSLFKAIEKAELTALYEGLPRDANEAQFSGQTTTIHGYPFFSTPLELPAKDKEQLQAFLGSERSFDQWTGYKKCGGFHPDFCVEWTLEGEVYRMLICFGCCEVEIHGPRKSLRCDFGIGTQKQFEELLKKHSKHTPPDHKE